MTTSKTINFAEVAALAAQAPARVKGVFTFEVGIIYTEGTSPKIIKGIEVDATTLKAAIREAGQTVARFKKAYEPISIMLFFYINGLCVGNMHYYYEIGNIRCDFSGLAVSNAVKEETPAEVEETAAETTAEPTHAARCLDIYLHNTSEIYSRYTKNAITVVKNAFMDQDKHGARLEDNTAWENLKFWISWQDVTKGAVKSAVKLVKKYDGLTPTAKDIENVTRDFAAYIIEEAQYQVKTS